MTCPKYPVGKRWNWSLLSVRHSFSSSVWPSPHSPPRLLPRVRSRATFGPGFHPVHLPAPLVVTWYRSTCCYCGCGGASPRAVRGERMENGGGQAAWRGPQPPPYRVQGPHLGGAGQELLLLPGRCHRGDEAQQGQVLPFLLEKKRKVVNSTSKDHSLPHLKVFKCCWLPLGKNPDLVVHKALQNSTSLISSLPLSPACWASTLPMAYCLAHPAYIHLALCCSHCWEVCTQLFAWLALPSPSNLKNSAPQRVLVLLPQLPG